MSARVIEQGSFHARRGVEPGRQEQLDRARRRLAADKLGVLERAGQVQVIGSPLADGDAHTRAVKLLDHLQWRIVADEVGPFDDRVWRGEQDPGGAQRVYGQEGHVPRLRLERGDNAGGGVECHKRHRHGETGPELACQVDRYTRRLTPLQTAVREHRVAEIDRGAQHAARSQLVNDLW